MSMGEISQFIKVTAGSRLFPKMDRGVAETLVSVKLG
jgi:hypothetical protein